MKKIELQFTMHSQQELQSRGVFRTQVNLLDQFFYENTLNA